MLDVPALRAHLDGGLERAGVRLRAGWAIELVDRHTVALADGSRASARIVVDASGARQSLGAAKPPPVAAEQTAYGVVVDPATAAALVGPGEALFMDWRPEHGEPGHPTFLYAVPLAADAVLLEETSLARRPGLSMPVLRRRLLARLARHGVSPPADAPTEQVLIPLDRPRLHIPGVIGFGAATPLVHPASGFSLATTLRLAPPVAHALATRLPGGEDPALAAARSVLWPPAARAVHRFRRIGLEALLRMPPAQVREFFETFFELPPRYPWAYLTGRDDLRGTAAAMTALFARSDWAQRARLIGPALLPPAPPDDGRERALSAVRS
jgi:lycopene beta-cyclase